MKISIPSKVIAADIVDKSAKKLWSNPRISISNQFKPAPGEGIDLNVKIIIAVPIIVLCCNLLIVLISSLIIMAIKISEDNNIISFESLKFREPKIKVKITKKQLPINIW